MQTPAKSAKPSVDPTRLSVELTNICNLHCSYCMRDEDALYHTKANFFPADLLGRIIREARATCQIDSARRGLVSSLLREPPRSCSRPVDKTAYTGRDTVIGPTCITRH